MGYNILNSFATNIKAIETEFSIRKENRKATGSERAILKQYSGFGGNNHVLLLDIDDKCHPSTDANVINLLSDLKNVLINGVNGDKQLYKELVSSIKNSVLTAYYTPQPVISAVSENIQRIFSKNDLVINSFLETSAGIGGFLPVANNAINKVAFEKDLVTGLILSSLEANTKVFIDGFETIESKELDNSSFDIIASNIPFGNLKIYDADFSQKGEPYISSGKDTTKNKENLILFPFPIENTPFISNFGWL